jgi:hypothetical protein
LLVVAAALAADPVDRLTPGCGEQPGARALGDTVSGPPFDGDEARVLQGVLGEVEVAEEPDQRGQNLS